MNAIWQYVHSCQSDLAIGHEETDNPMKETHNNSFQTDAWAGISFTYDNARPKRG